MRDERPSFTAAWVAACRGLGALLPEDLRLISDPYGLRFAGRGAARLAELMRRAPAIGALLLKRPLLREVLWLQLRTRVLDDALLDFLRAGGRQVLLLGAGFDCRAARFQLELAESIVFEVDHPATQAKKRRVLGEVGFRGPGVEYLAWDFERQPLADLPAALAARGHDPARPTLTIWEGVTMYLSEEAIEASVAAVCALSAPGSIFAFTYTERDLIDHPSIQSRFVALVGEPFRFGWDPAALPGWLAERGFSLLSDLSAVAIAASTLPPRADIPVEPRRHVAIARRSM